MGTPVKQIGEVRPARVRLLHDRRFWLSVTVIAAIAIVYDIDEVKHFLPESRLPFHVPHEFARDSLFIIPVVYAARSFGLRGALWAAAWCTLITVPNWLFLHSGEERVGAMSQLTIVYAVAIFVGLAVNQEQSARATAEDALAAAGARYRALFESAGEGILLLRGGDEIAEGNAAAEELVGLRAGQLTDARLADALPPLLANALAGPLQERSDIDGDVRLVTADGREKWVEPVRSELSASDGLTQVVLRDVTARRRRVTALESYAAAMLRAQEEERKRLGQEIHDDTMQSLVLICRSLDAVEDGQDIKEVQAQLANLRRLAESTHDSLRALLAGLRPSLLDDLGLTAALGSLISDLEERTDIRAALHVEGDARLLLPEQELALYRIAQEALRNIERHSGASAGTITVRFGPAKVELSVRDNGRGFDLLLAGDGRLGVLGMRECARVVGGDFKIHSYLGGGTTVTASVPDAVAAAV